MTIDTIEDYELLSQVLSKVEIKDIKFNINQVLEFLAANPQVYGLNRGIKRNKVLKYHYCRTKFLDPRDGSELSN